MKTDRIKGSIRPKDIKINALSRLIDSVIIGYTLVHLVSVMSLKWVPVYSWMLLMSILAFNFLSESTYSHRGWQGTNVWKGMKTVAVNWGLVVIVLVLSNLLFNSDELYNQQLVFYWFIFTPIELVSWHAIVRMLLRYAKESGLNTQTVAILGANDLGASLEKRIVSLPWSSYYLKGYYDDRVIEDGRDDVFLNKKTLGGFTDLVSEAKKGNIHVVFVALPMSAENRISALFKELSDTTVSVYMMLDVFSFDLLNARWLDIGGMPAVSIYESPFTGVDGVTKRIFDIVVGTAILCLIAIPMCFIALGVKLTSPGPVLFKQKRYGMRGEEISVWKFRSMTVSDNNDSGVVVQATKGDARITPYGAFLRKTSLDEFPQFFNVLAGSMSIVGPRPHAISHNEYYRSSIRGYMLRHKVKPGITGWAQINGFRGETDTLDKMEGRIKYDLEYIRRWTIYLDIKIILLTIVKGFSDKNAY